MSGCEAMNLWFDDAVNYVPCKLYTGTGNGTAVYRQHSAKLSVHKSRDLSLSVILAITILVRFETASSKSKTLFQSVLFTVNKESRDRPSTDRLP